MLLCCACTSLGPTLDTPWTVACQAPLSLGFFRKECWSRLPFPPPGDLPNPGIEPVSPASLAMQADSLPAKPSRKPLLYAGYSVCPLLCRVSFKAT